MAWEDCPLCSLWVAAHGVVVRGSRDVVVVTPLICLPSVGTVVAMHPVVVSILVHLHVWGTCTQMKVGILRCVSLVLVACPAWSGLVLLSSPTAAAATAVPLLPSISAIF